MRSLKALGAAVVAAGVVAVAVPLTSFGQASEASEPGTPAGWTKVWSDDFTGAAGSRINTNNWIYDIGHSYPGGAANWGTGEIAYHSDSTQNVYQAAAATSSSSRSATAPATGPPVASRPPGPTSSRPPVACSASRAASRCRT